MVLGRNDRASLATRSTEKIGGPHRREVPPPEQLARGTIVGRYTVLSLVGRGGMSEVYGAYDPALDRKVALKVLQPGLGDQDRQQTRLHREARAIAQISHPNVVAVHEVGTFADRVFIAIEFVEGKTLRDWLEERPRPSGAILGAFIDAARGLAAAHAKGLIHRDFKPHNVLVRNDGVVRVTDFGLARWIDEVAGGDAEDDHPRNRGLDLTKTGQLVGTPRYMAPEQLDGGPMDGRTDQFAFCVALYEALFGEHPFGSSGGAMDRAAAIKAGPVRLPSARSAVPAWQRRVILRGLAADPADRWRSMDELIAALTTDPVRQRRRRWWAVAVASVAVVGVVAAARTRGQSDRAICLAERSGLDGIWGPSGQRGPTEARRNAVHGAFLATGVSTAADVWERTSSLLDRYADEWQRLDRDSCEATRVRHEQPAAVLDQRSACLAERREALRALVDVLATADAQMIPRAVDAAIALPALDLCAASQSERAPVTPGDPAVRARIDDIRRRALGARAQHDAGRDRQAIVQAKALLREARAIAYRPLIAELLWLIGMAQLEVLDPEASTILEETVWLSLSANRDELAATAASNLAWLTSDYLQHPAEGERWTRLSEVLLERMPGGNERLRSWLLNDQAVARLHGGQFQEGLQLAREALALKREIMRPDDPDIARTLNNMAEAFHLMGDDQAALAEIDEAHRVLVRAYGPRGSLVAQALSNRGEYLAGLGRFEEALVSFQEALTLWQPQMAPDHRVLAYPLTGMGEALLALGRPLEALPPLERAWRIREAGEPRVPERGITAFALARAAAEASDRRRARSLAQTARANYQKRAALYAGQIREIDLWLARHPLSARDSRSTAEAASGAAKANRRPRS